MKTLVKKCARCGNDHEVEFKEFQHFGIGDCNWWGMCPYINEPILMKIITTEKYPGWPGQLWETVRYGKTSEPLDKEIISLCDALNNAGFVTISSCSGHGKNWAHVWFEHSSDERIESMIRYVKKHEEKNEREYFSMWQKEVQDAGYEWCVEIHLNDVYGDTPKKIALKKTEDACNKTAQTINSWAAFG